MFTHLHLVSQLLALSLLHFPILVEGPHDELLRLLRSKTGRVGPFSLHRTRLLSHRLSFTHTEHQKIIVQGRMCFFSTLTYVLIHLVSNVLVEALLFLSDHFVLRRADIFICFDPLEVLSHDRFVHIFLFGDFLFVTLQSLPPGVTLGGIAVLNDAMVLLRADIATVVQLFDLACDKRGISYQTITAKVNVTVDGWGHQGA